MRVLPSLFQSRPMRVIAIAALVALAGSASAVGAQDQRKPGPTFTNSTALAADEVEHVVKKGDTLWDIAKAYLKDPFKWPEVFRRNSDIVENPHWIYPGENIRIPKAEVKPEVLAKIDTKPAPRSDHTVFSTVQGAFGDRLSSDGKVIGREASLGVSPGEIESAPFGDRKGGPAGSGRLAAAYDRPGIDAPDAQRRFSFRDRVFVEMPAGVAASPGQLLMVYRLGKELSDDAQLIIPTGIVRIESQNPGQPALASIVRQFGEIRLDQAVTRFVSTAANPGTPAPLASGSSEKVMFIASDPVLPSLQSYVVMTARSAISAKVGDRYTLIEDNVDTRYPAPPVPAAVAEVVRVTPFAITAILIDQDQPRIRPGMTARLTARMP